MRFDPIFYGEPLRGKPNFMMWILSYHSIVRRLERHEWYLLLVGPPFVALVTWVSADWVHETFGVGWLVSYLVAPFLGVLTIAGLVGARSASTRDL